MSALQAMPTQHGIDILNSELKNTVTKYRLIGALTHDAPSESLYSFYEDTIETSYYDDNGVLTFILNLPIEMHFDEYLHQIHVLDSNDQSVIECSTPKVALPKGIGGMVTLKAAVSGEAGQVIFKHSEFVTETELNELHLAPIKAALANMVGMIGEFHHSGEKPAWVDLKGGELSRITDRLLWDYAVAAGMTVVQATKDADPMTHAMRFGDGDGSTTFTLPNHHLGHFVRGTPSGVSHGDTQDDAIRNITGNINTNADIFDEGANGAFRNGSVDTEKDLSASGNVSTAFGSVSFDASRVVPTASENRPYTANLSIKIHRGWM
ncbi:Phage tail collar domain-containing protein [Vibrio crassostreae]|nr:Phage tail collar domain-containing protein [Vibrio crassostreae]